ncbi:MAG: ribbon-helix-helix protein, CopG family [Polyangiaceae bacterium]|nr:ribbon-helix-helix protein, CopG family [Polyangiaceae bacterium]
MKGRPRKHEEVGGTSPRSVRFSVWKLIEARAKQRGISVHAALREAILEWRGKDAACVCSGSHNDSLTLRRGKDSGRGRIHVPTSLPHAPCPEAAC